MARELSRVGEAARPLAAHPGAETPDRAQAPSFSACLEAFRAECRTARPIHLALLREIGDGFRCLVHTARSCAGAHLGEMDSPAITWTWATAVMLGRNLLRAVLTTLAWIASASRRVALALAKAVSKTGYWIGDQLAALGHALKRWLYLAWL